MVYELSPKHNIGPALVEKAVVAFFSQQSAMILWCTTTGYMYIDITERVGPYDVAGYLIEEIPFPNDIGFAEYKSISPDHGIWVWEGRVTEPVRDSYSGEYDDPEYITNLWRQPNEEEWAAIMAQRNPFESRAD